MKTLKRKQFDVILPPGGGPGGPPPPNAPKPKGVQQIPPQGGGKSEGGVSAEPYAPRVIKTKGKDQSQDQDQDQGSGQGQDQGSGQGQGQGQDKGQGQGSVYKASKVQDVRNRGIGGMLSEGESRQMQKDLGVPEISPPSEEEIKQTLRENFPLLNKGKRNTERHPGIGKGNMTRLLPDAISKIIKPLIDWKAALKKYIGRILGDQREAVMPNRRFVSSGDYVYGSRKMKNKMKTCVVAVDVSGSVRFEELQIMINEIKGIAMQNRINDFEIVYFDDGIEHVEKLSGKEVASYKPTVVGGGGTSFKEPLEYMNQINKKGDLDLAVFMTDGYANLNLPVPAFKNKFIWVIIDHASFQAPFGSKIIHISVKG